MNDKNPGADYFQSKPLNFTETPTSTVTPNSQTPTRIKQENGADAMYEKDQPSGQELFHTGVFDADSENAEGNRGQQLVIAKNEDMNYKEFMGCRIFQDENHKREQLPDLRPEQTVAVWKLLKGVIGQDLRQVSFPCILNSPLSGLQLQCDMLINGESILARAAATDNAAKRLALGYIAQIVPYQGIRMRKKKPFNPMLAETFEYVTDNFRFLAEKVAHRPNQILAFCLDGRGYRLLSNNNIQAKFKFNGGRGQLDLTQFGCRDVYFQNYDEHVSYNHLCISAKNIIYGGLYTDLKNQVAAINHKTGEKVVVDFIEKVPGANDSQISGKAFDSDGNAVFEIKGSWLDQISITTLATGESEVVWTAAPLIPNAHLQFFLNMTTI